jgi:hypothetical protein
MKKIFILSLALFAVVFSQNSPKINGFFIQPSIGYGVADYQNNFKTQEYYDDWVKSMSDIGATMLFYQWVCHYEENQKWFSDVYGGASSADFCYYHPDLTEISGVPVNSWMPAINYWTGNNVSPVQRVLDAGERNSVKIWLGLYLNENGTFNWWDAVADNDISPQDSATFRYHVERSVDLVRDLVDKFGNHPALGGFYYPIEIANLGFEERETWDILVWLLDSVATQVHKLSGKKLAISPFFNVNLTSGADWGEMWDYALSISAIDIIMLQDGVGVEPNILTETNDLVSPYYEAVRDACHRNGKSFWANSELFKNSSGKRDTLIASPSSIEKLLLQLNTEAEFADTFVCFSYLALDPYVQVTPLDADYPLNQRQKLYNDYKEYYESIKNEEGGQGETAVEKRKLDLPNYRISVSGRNITIPKMDKPVHYSLVSPNGKVILSGIAKDKCTIKAPVQYGIYIFMTGFTDALPMRQKIFIQKDIQSTVDYQLRSR